MKDKLIEMVQFVQANDQDRYNPETYQTSKLEHDGSSHFNWSILFSILFMLYQDMLERGWLL